MRAMRALQGIAGNAGNAVASNASNARNARNAGNSCGAMLRTLAPARYTVALEKFGKRSVLANHPEFPAI